MLDKRGNSSTEESIKLIENFIESFGGHRVDYILGDSEFIGKEWLSWLIETGLPFYLRIRKDAIVKIGGKEKKAYNLFRRLRSGESLHKNNLVTVYGTEVYFSGKKIMSDERTMDYVIIISYNAPRQ